MARLTSASSSTTMTFTRTASSPMRGHSGSHARAPNPMGREPTLRRRDPAITPRPGLAVAEPRAQPLDRAPQQLARARRRDVHRRGDLLERELLDVVEAQQRRVARLERRERLLD